MSMESQELCVYVLKELLRLQHRKCLKVDRNEWKNTMVVIQSGPTWEMTVTQTRTVACPRSFEPSSFFCHSVSLVHYFNLQVLQPQSIYLSLALFFQQENFKMKKLHSTISCHALTWCLFHSTQTLSTDFICVFISIIWLFSWWW